MKKFLYFFIVVLFFSCGKSSSNIDPNDNPGNQFDRGTILSNIYDNIILPAYNDLNANLIDLENKISLFIQDPTQINLNQTRVSWVQAYKSWQGVAMFNLRKAEEVSYAAIMNTYPCNESKIDNNINDSIFEIGLLSPSLLGTMGFPAIGYLIYGNDSTNVLSVYTNSNAQKHKVHLMALIQNMRYNTDLVIADWNSNRSDFVNSTSNTSTSSLNIIVNDFLQYFEKRVREAKVAIPSGVRGNLMPRPDQIESLYKPDICKVLLQEAFNSVKRLYKGDSYDGFIPGVGLEDYLSALNSTEDLINAIDNQLDIIDENINMLENDFILQLNNDNQKMFDVFYSMQTLVTYTKTDMLSFMNISTDYMDNDGD
tara:strand:+ start:380 stop:1486 length:1107 start_codon:yes stop_codon:yes gene_type:complete